MSRRVLFWVEPLIEMGRPYWKEGWATLFSRKMSDALRAAPSGPFECAIALNEPLAERYEARPDERVFVFTQEELLRPFPGGDYLDASLAWFHRTHTAGQFTYYVDLLRRRLGGFEPDVVITYSPAPFFREAYPQATLLHKEYSIFSRAPFPESWHLDPEGVSLCSCLNSHYDEVETTLPEASLGRLSGFKQQVQQLLRERSPFDDRILPLREKYRHLLLLPLQFSSYYIFDGQTSHRDQYRYLTDVLDRVPEDIGVIVTMHPEYPLHDTDTFDWLGRKYPNLVFDPDFERFYGASQYLLSYVDGVVTVSSSIGLQTLLWDVKLISLGSRFLTFMADATDLRDVGAVLQRPGRNRDALLHWILTRYAVTADYLHDPAWCESFLERAMDVVRRGGSPLELYRPIDDEATLFERLSASLDPGVPRENPSLGPERLREVNRRLEDELRALSGELEETNRALLQLSTLAPPRSGPARPRD